MEYGDLADNMYIVLKGRAKAEIRNEAITDWDWFASLNNALIEWKSKEFDPKIKQPMKLRYEEEKA